MADRDPGPVGGLLAVDREGGGVVLDGEHEVRAELGDHMAGQGTVAVQLAQQRGEGGDLVALRADRVFGEHDTGGVGRGGSR
ncbi:MULTISPECIES: hypothetical protein [unclassified Frankia]|uniref:hypothetical protein n=1 Tax=unclassified Frankia TaxID=2632575 RepID=UPI001EF67719|nr:MULTISPECIES: hypothetical protein [unclassified Frankia]